MAKKILVDAAWLVTCGMQDVVGRPLPVTRESAARNGWIMYDVTLPGGRPWTVWSIRGVTILDDTAALLREALELLSEAKPFLKSFKHVTGAAVLGRQTSCLTTRIDRLFTETEA